MQPQRHGCTEAKTSQATVHSPRSRLTGTLRQLLQVGEGSEAHGHGMGCLNKTL